MKIKVDRSVCTGHAMCASRAPELFELDEEGFCVSDGKIVPQALEEQARRGKAVCPEAAITLIED